MILTKYRMFIENGYIETLDIEEAKLHGDYIIIEEELIEEEVINTINF
jgi:hypothetical protein